MNPPSITRRERLLALLASGEFQSGERLAAQLRISRSAVWKLVKSLQELGVDIQAVPRQGYRLPQPVDLLDAKSLLDAMPRGTLSKEHCIVLLEVDSTNRYVADLPPPPLGSARLCTAEVQSAGRGRRGRSWVAPFGSGICMSLAWQFESLPPAISTLSLVVGVCVCRVLHRLGCQDVGLKWPNDLVWQHRKLAGILIELKGEAGGPSSVVIGIGLNSSMPDRYRASLAREHAVLVTDLNEVFGQGARCSRPTRNEVIAAITTELVDALGIFAVHGFEPFLSQWRELDAIRDLPVQVILGTETIRGTARGVEADGALLVEVAGKLQRFIVGEVSLRRA